MGPKKPQKEVQAWASSTKSTKISIALLSVAILLSTVAISDVNGNFANSINKITENLDRALEDIFGNQDIVYTDLNHGIPYVNYTRVQFDPVGMAELYNITNLVLGVLVRDIDPALVITIDKTQPNQLPTLRYDTVPELLKQYAGLLVLLVVLALMIVFFPLCGLCFCCCRCCCGKCGGRKKMADKKGDLCRKILNGTLLIVLGTSILFCVVCAFGSNQQFNDGLQQFSSNMKKSVKDTDKFLNDSKIQMHNLLSKNFQEFNVSLVNIMERSSSTVVNELMEFSNATSMTNLATFVNNIPSIREDMSMLKNLTNILRVKASTLNDAMRKVKSQLLNILNNCSLQECADFKRQVDYLQTNIDFNKLPDISNEIAAFREFKIEDLQKAAKSGIEKLNSVKKTIHREFEKNILDAQRHLASAGRTIDKNLKQINEAIDDMREKLDENSDPYLEKSDFYIKKFGPYVHYVGTGIACCLLAIAIFISLGLIWGICGKRPDGYNDNCCNKGAGSKLLICGVSLMFLTGFLFAIVIVALSLLGIASQKGVCEPLRQPSDSKILNYLKENFDLKQFGLKVDFQEVHDRCANNESIYKVFNLESRFKMREIIKKLDINKTLDGLNFDKSVPEDFFILNKQSRDVLNKLVESTANFNFDKFVEELENNTYTTVSLEDVKKQLKVVYNKAPESLKSDLNLSLIDLENYEEKILIPMIKVATRAKEIAINLGTAINMGKSSFSMAISDLIDEIQRAERMIKNEGKRHLVETAIKFIDAVKKLVYDYVSRVTRNIEWNVGRCEKLYRVYDFALVSTCDRILLPLNGYWLNLFCCLLLYIPTIIISTKLAVIYQKRKSNGVYVEAEYLYDAYSDRDNIPLNSRNKSNKKVNKKKTKRYEDRPQNVGGEIVAREYPSGSQPDARYADMAPKHWEEFPAGGPPQYQRAPTEYERPPPYYYPGQNGEN